MADSSLPVQPASPAPVSAPAQVKVFTLPGPGGTTVLAQAVAIVDDQGRLVAPLTESTGQALLEAIVNLTQVLVDQGQGALMPSSRSGVSLLGS